MKQTILRAALLCTLAYMSVLGNGWCVNSEGNEGTAWSFVKLGCKGAENMCVYDEACLAFACGAGTKSYVLYTSRDCAANCDVLDWVRNPSLIVNASRDRTYMRTAHANWVNGACYVQTEWTSHSADAHSCSTSLSVANSTVFTVGDGIRISTVEVKTVIEVSAGALVVATPLIGQFLAGTKVMKLGVSRQSCNAGYTGTVAAIETYPGGCSCNAGYSGSVTASTSSGPL